MASPTGDTETVIGLLDQIQTSRKRVRDLEGALTDCAEAELALEGLDVVRVEQASSLREFEAVVAGPVDGDTLDDLDHTFDGVELDAVDVDADAPGLRLYFAAEE